MTVLITMAGLGSRFRSSGYVPPKHRLIANGRSLFEWSLESLRCFREETLVLATLKDEEGDWLVKKARDAGFSDVQINPRSGLSGGQAQTAFDALAGIDVDGPLWIYNIDTFISDLIIPTELGQLSGCIPVFESMDPGMSYIEHVEGTFQVKRIVEKEVISSWATVGMYGFASVKLFINYYKEAYEKNRAPLVNGELYVAPIYQLMLEDSLQLIAPTLPNNSVFVLGTPDQLLAFDPLARPPFGNSS